MRKSQEREMYKVSFIVPLYNGRKYIEGLVSAIQKIDYSNIELIFIDDGSTDKSKELYDIQYRDMEDIYYIYQSNGGIANARNVGVDNANGDYLIFLDQDDSINPQNMTKAILRAVEDNVDILLYTTERKKGNITWGCDVVYDDIKVIDKKEISKILKSIIFREENSYSSYVGHVWGGIYKKSIVYNNKIKFKKFIDYEDDQLFVFDYLCMVDSVDFFSECCYYWEVNSNSCSSSFRPIKNGVEKYKNYFSYLRNKYYIFSKDDDIDDDIREFGCQFSICECIRNLLFLDSNSFDAEFNELMKFVNKNKVVNDVKTINVHISDIKYRIILLILNLGLIQYAILISRLYIKLKYYIIGRCYDVR